MENWPHRTSSTGYVSKPRKAKSQTSSESPGYPVVEYGAITAATVHREANRLKWTFLSKDNSERRLIIIRDPAKVFPATRRIPARSNLNPSQAAEQTTQFLRLHYPDADFPQDIVRDHIAQDLDFRHKLREFDPYSGNILTTLSLRPNTYRAGLYIAFPMGETSCELNVSPVLSSADSGLVFKPDVTPAWVSSTPILQLVSPTLGLPSNAGNKTVLAARTYSSTLFLEVFADSKKFNSPEVLELGSITNTQTGSRPSTDVLLHSATSSRALLVNDRGALYAYAVETGAVSVKTPESAFETNENFFRLSHASNEDTCFLLTSSDILAIDLRTSNSSKTIYRGKPMDLFTDFAWSSQTGLLTVCSTTEILWFDTRYNKRPLFSVNHGRKHDRHLRISNFTFDEEPLTFLTSRRNGLLNVYDVSKDSDSLLHLNTPAYTLPSIPILGSARTGFSWLQYPDDQYRACLLQLSNQGSLHRIDVELGTSSANANIDRYVDRGCDWSEVVQQLEKDVESQQEDTGPTGERGYEETDLIDVYAALFCEDVPDDDNSTAAYDLLETMPVFWQKQEEPIEHMLTAFDIAFRSGAEPRDPSRADFFTGTPLDSVRGYRALKQGRIPMEVLKRRSASHWDMRPVHKRFVSEMYRDPTDHCNTLSRYDLIADDDRSATSYRREAEARDQLALDLSLSSDVFASRAIKTSKVDSVEDDVETMSNAAEAMSISKTEPPQVKFGFLDPIPVEETEKIGPSMSGINQTVKSPLGIRLLLSEWSIGDDPQEYNYVDPYDVNATPSRPLPQRKEQPRKRTPPPVALQPSRIQKPPTIAVKTAPAAPPAIALTQSSRPAPVPAFPQSQQSLPRAPQGGSQPTQTEWSSNSQSQSQMPVMSTQVLPGPHGGRPQPVKKKPPKKRIGGF